MSGDRYFITNQHQTYFITCTIVNWIDLFTRPVYKEIITDSLNFCVKQKNLKLNGWVLMSNHIHFLGRCEEPNRMSDFLRDFKKFTSKELAKAVIEYPESRREWLLDKFNFEARVLVVRIITRYGRTITMRLTCPTLILWKSWNICIAIPFEQVL